MDTNKHEFDRAIALMGPPTSRREQRALPGCDYGVVAVLVSNTETNGTGVRSGERLYNYCTTPYLRWRRPNSSTAAKRSFFVKSGHSFGVTYISV